MSEFLSQGGYAGYVWSAFGVTFGLLLIEIIQLRASQRTILTRIGRLVRLRTPRASAGKRSRAAPAAGSSAAETSAGTRSKP